MIGAIEFVKSLTGARAAEAAYAIIRSEAGGRFFVPPTEAPAGLARGDRVTFDVDRHADPRGPIAVRVRLLERAASPPAPDQRFPDVVLHCANCGDPFTFSSGEQAFYRGRDFDPPRRCKPCRRARTGALRGRE